MSENRINGIFAVVIVVILVGISAALAVSIDPNTPTTSVPAMKRLASFLTPANDTWQAHYAFDQQSAQKHFTGDSVFGLDMQHTYNIVVLREAINKQLLPKIQELEARVKALEGIPDPNQE